MSPLQETGNHNPSDPDFEEWRQVNGNIILFSIIPPCFVRIFNIYSRFAKYLVLFGIRK
jgi:hypothetical protein